MSLGMPATPAGQAQECPNPPHGRMLPRGALGKLAELLVPLPKKADIEKYI